MTLKRQITLYFMKKQLTPTELWHISAEALHTKEYRGCILLHSPLSIRDKKLSIWIQRCGSGFRQLILSIWGYKNIEQVMLHNLCCRAQGKLHKLGITIPIHTKQWQELAAKIPKKFDVVVNSDNSFVTWMAGWERSCLKVKRGSFEKMQVVLQNFYDVLSQEAWQ